MSRSFNNFRVQRMRRSEQGLVLIVTLLILVAMILVSTALLRSSDTSLQVVSNLSFRQAAEAPANIAVERAVQDIQNNRVNGTPLPAYFYNARQPGENVKGIPATLLSSGSQAGEGYIQVLDMDVRFIVERMCSTADAPTAANCVFGGAGFSEVPTHMDAEFWTGSTMMPVYRVSVRVDGVKNTAVFAQAFIN